LTGSNPHVIVLPGGGYATHSTHEGEPIARWLRGLGIAASVFRYPLNVRHPAPLNALRGEIRRLRDGGSERIGVIGFSAGGHLAGLFALADGADADEAVDFAVLGYAITSMETETYRPARGSRFVRASNARSRVRVSRRRARRRCPGNGDARAVYRPTAAVDDEGHPLPAGWVGCRSEAEAEATRQVELASAPDDRQ
jgi:acetyl esterase/lipase